uniref:extracellular matrix protein 1 isoform X2 n=1 Tax=Monopterus albus TaxID=43700 RepID=UPI0009B4771E|nr:extracellular matrix protein 1-like isoform X2 [Monopterus albus]
MNSAGGLIGFWIIALLTLHAANLGETNYNFLNEPNVPFPPARPTVRNLAAICHCGQGRPRYLASFFPSSGASHFRRRGSAINRLESWYSLCCSGQVAHSSSQILCCARQAAKGDARWMCFNSELPNPNYYPVPDYTAPKVPLEPGFTFNPYAC